MNKKYNYVYRITHIETGICYIGVHSTDNMFDNYMGSGSVLKNIYKKYNYDYSLFKKEILADFDNRNSALKYERMLVTPEFIKSEQNYNLVIGGGFHGKSANKHNNIKSLDKLYTFFSILDKNKTVKRFFLYSENIERIKKITLLNNLLGYTDNTTMKMQLDILNWISYIAPSIISTITDEDMANRFRGYGFIILQNDANL